MNTDLLNAALMAVTTFFILRMLLAWKNRISSDEARALVDGGAVLLDVRTAGEFKSGGLPGAINIPVQGLAGRLGELSKERPVVVYCASGMRSSKAVGVLRKGGFDAHDVGPQGRY